MRMKLFDKNILLRQRRSVRTLLVLVVLTGSFLLNTFVSDDLNISKSFTFKVALTNSQHGAIPGEKYSYCYFIKDKHWKYDDGGHFDEEDIDFQDRDDRENEESREIKGKRKNI